MTQEGFSTLTIGMTMACYFMGLIFAVYPLAVARANDVLEGKEAVAISSALLLCYSIGAIFGPVMASITLTLLKTPYGLFIYWSVVAGLFALMTLYLRRKERIAIIEPAEQVNFAPMRNTSPVAMVLDPRADTKADK